MTFYPVNLDIRDQLCVVIGGGVVAKRKVEALLCCEPQIVVISPKLCSGLLEIYSKKLVTWKEREFQAGDLAGARLVFAATDNEKTQQRVVQEADKAAIPVNVISDPGACTFQVPAMCRRGDLLLTVGTCGASPALAARIRKELEENYGHEYALLLSFMAAVRKQVVADTRDSGRHKQLFEKLLDSDILSAIHAADWTQLIEIAEKILPSGIEVAAIVNTLQREEKRSMEEPLSC